MRPNFILLFLFCSLVKIFPQEKLQNQLPNSIANQSSSIPKTESTDNSNNLPINKIKTALKIKAKLSPEFLSRDDAKKTSAILTIEFDKSELYDSKNIINVTVDEDESTLSKKDYEITKGIGDINITDNRSHEIVIIFAANKDNETAKKKIVFNLNITTPEKKPYFKELILTVTPENDSLDNFRYLAYIGTNFDLVDGIKAKNLFFASNIFIPPVNHERTGFYFSIYGNRTSSYRDSISNYRNNELKAIRTDASNNRYAIFETADVKVEGYSDNLGAYVAPLIRLWNQKQNFQIYYSPSTEFVWRRNVQNSTWYNSRESQPNYNAPELNQYSSNIEIALKSTASVSYNIYDWNLGLIGIFLNHESDRMSIRLNINTGPSWRYATSISGTESIKNAGEKIIEPTYNKDTDLFFSGKLWMTERYTGLTFEVEVANYMDNTSPYFGVTLSKAIDFGKLATIFQPITR